MLIDFSDYGGGGPIEQDFGYVQGATYESGTGISGGTALKTTAAKTDDLNDGAYLGFARQHRTGTMGVWAKSSIAGTDDSALIEVWQGDPCLAARVVGTDLQVWTINDGVLFTAAGALSSVSFKRIELQWTVSSMDENNQLNYDARVELRVDSVIADTATNIRLGFALPAGYSRDVFWNVVVFNPHGLGGQHYLTDGSGTINTGYMPDNVTIYTKLPVAGNGTYAEMTPSAGTDHGAMVDETSPDGDTTYLAVTGAAKKSTFNFEDFSSIGSQLIYGLKHVANGKKTEPGFRRFRPLAVRAGVPQFFASDFPIGIGYFSWQQALWETDPFTGSKWTVSGINATEFGSLVG